MNNEVTLVGCIQSLFSYSHSLYGENFYNATLSVKRSSGYEDLIPLLVSDRLIDTGQNYIGQCVYLKGQFRSYNERGESKTSLKLYVFVDSVELLPDTHNVNDIFLEGTLCKTPTYRHTPNGREISDLLLAVNRGYNKSDYIPCICWGRNAYYAKSLNTGDHVRIAGRIQSREYVKNGETKTAYEVSVNLVELC